MIEPTLMISLGSFLVAACVAYFTVKRGKSQDDKKDTTEMTTVIVKLESISSGISEIKSDMKNVKEDVVDLRERLAIVEQSTKSAHHRIDEIQGKTDERR